VPARLLVLFDVDGTLFLTHDKLVGEATSAAVEAVYGVALSARSIDAIDHPGQTQKRILRELLRGAGLSEADITAKLDRCCGEVAARYVQCLEGADTSSWASPAQTAETLEVLAGTAQLALLTGNPEPIARARMERLGLARFFPEGQGAFGCEREEKAALIALARERAGDWPVSRTVEVGDTPADVASAAVGGVRSIAVCWGRFDPEQLSGADAHVGEMPELGPVLSSWRSLPL
jgi:phosphoglycolate phosphatase-like HAD superfamily hydrolase